jgi:nucleotide-binding universal stress UspA family protein
MMTPSAPGTTMRVLIGFDGTDGARGAIEDLQLAGLPAGVEAVVACVAEVPVTPPIYYLALPVEGGVVSEGVVEEALHAAERVRERAVAVAELGADLVRGLFPTWKVRPEPLTGSPHGALVEKAAAWPADLVVVGSRGRAAIDRLVFGSVSLNVLAHAPCSVRVGRGRGREAPRPPGAPVRVLLAVDGSPDSGAAVDALCRRAWPAGSEVRVATAVDARLSLDLTLLVLTPDEKKQLSPVQRLVHSVGDRLRGCKPEVSSVILEGDPKRVLLREAERWGADCVFGGARGHGRLERLLMGSVSASLAVRADCSVEVVRTRSRSN